MTMREASESMSATTKKVQRNGVAVTCSFKTVALANTCGVANRMTVNPRQG
jgi:hypothetical protein